MITAVIQQRYLLKVPTSDRRQLAGAARPVDVDASLVALAYDGVDDGGRVTGAHFSVQLSL